MHRKEPLRSLRACRDNKNLVTIVTGRQCKLPCFPTATTRVTRNHDDLQVIDDVGNSEPYPGTTAFLESSLDNEFAQQRMVASLVEGFTFNRNVDWLYKVSLGPSRALLHNTLNASFRKDVPGMTHIHPPLVPKDYTRTMSASPVLNPLVYLNFLPAETGAQYEVFRNVQIAALGAYSCDMLTTLPQEMKMMRSSKLTLSIFAYWIARIFAIIDLTSTVFSATGPVDNCQQDFLVMSASYAIVGAATSFLFLRRVQAVFFDNKAVNRCFTALWLMNVVIWALAPIGLKFTEIADTKHCIATRQPFYLAAGCVAPLVYDSLVFLSISYKVVTSYCLPRGPSTWRAFFYRPLPHHLPRAILYGGQKYYLVSVCANLAGTLLMSIPAVPPVYRVITLNPAMALTSSMACRVFRNLFLEDVEAESKASATAVLTSVVCQTVPVSVETNEISSQGRDQSAPHSVV